VTFFFSTKVAPDLSQTATSVARDAHGHEQQLLADIVMTSVVVGSSPLLNTPMLQEGIAGQRQSVGML
jgi:hypothetical protein